MFAQDFLDGRISYREFNNSVRLGDTGRQFVLKSNRAFDRLIYEGYETARFAEYYPAAVTRDRSSRYKSFVPKEVCPIYINDIISENIMPYDSRL
jgi:hypothetical protein